MKFDEFIHDNLKIILIAIAALFVVIVGAVALSVAFGGETTRSLTISEISGNVVIIRGEKQFYANRRTVLQSGDVINTAENGTVRVRIDTDKYISVEPESAVYVFYTKVSDKGEVSVNIANGAVTCQLNKPLKKSEKFRVLTPNAAISVRGTVFRTEFSYESKYRGYENVMLTHVQDFDGQVILQLYGTDGEKVEEPMLLTERTGAEMISADSFAQYGYLNYDINIFDLKEISIKELIRISGEKTLAYSLDELNSAFRAVSLQNASTETVTVSQETSVSETTSAPPEETTATSRETAVTTPGTVETVPKESVQQITPGTTLETHIYTTFPGPKWWQMPNPNPDSWDDYDIDDYFDEYDLGRTDEENTDFEH
ncbi:MAG: FecR domain-containing protein [Oscillospiraceae bacterium]